MAVELTAPGTRSRRGRATRTSPATSSATACALFYEVYGVGRADGPADADVVDHPLAALEDADPLPRAPLPRAHVRRARQRPLRPARRADAYREEEFAADALAVMDATGTERAVLVSLSRGAERSLLLAASHPERVEQLVFIAPALPLPPATPRLKAIAGVRRAARRVRRLGEVEPPLLGRALRGLPRVLLLAVLHRAALDEAARGRGRLGSRDRRRDAGRDSARAAAARTRRACASFSPASTARCS